MRRDMELIRSILLEMERWPANHANQTVEVHGRTEEEIMYHLGLMHQAGLIHALNVSSREGDAWIPVDILWQGHEFLDAARSDTVWLKAKDRVLSTAGTLSLEAMKIALPWALRQLITGV